MADSIRATPQNAALGAIADLLKRTYAPQRTQQMQGVMEFLGAPAVARTLERLSYGQPVTNAGKANVPLLPDDTAEAAMVLAPPLGSLARRVGTNLVQTAPYVARDIAQSMSSPLRSNVVKPKGGNWLSGSVESAMRPLRTSDAPVLSGDIVNDAAGRDIFSEYRKVYDKDPTIGLHDWMRANHPDIYAQIQNPEDRAINRWLDTKLSKYIRNEMGTPEDPVRALAERGVVHQEQRPLSTYNLDEIEAVREKAGFPAEGLAQTRAGREWEAATDYAIVPDEAWIYNREPHLRDNPWLLKVPPNTPVYGTDRNASANMFGHLIDELKFSMDPNSGLPAALRLDPKDIDKVTVPQAVERVAKINAWRAEQAAQAEKAGMLENLKATPRLADESLELSFVDKPGGAWVDIPETVDDKGMQVCNSIGKAGGWCTQHKWAASDYGSGPNRLTALVDAEGRPHAQAKITNDVDEAGAFDSVLATMTPEQEAAYMHFADTLDGPAEVRDVLGWMREQAPDLYKDYQEILKSQASGPPNIMELKPVGNSFSSHRAKEYAKRDPQYKQKVTESVLKFLNSGEWGKVRDLDNYDIVDLTGDPVMLTAYLRDITGQDSRTAQALFNDFIYSAPDIPRFVSARQLKDMMKPAEGFAAGGFVGLAQKYQAGGRVRPGEGLPEPSLLNFQLYADTVSREMFPGERDNAKRDAARHLIASALAAQKTSPGVAEFLGKAHEFKEAPLRTAGYWLGLTEPRADYHTDTHNNALGVALGRDKRDLREMLDAVEAATRAGTPQRQPGRVSLEPDADTRYAEGGLVAYDPEEINSIASRVREELHG